MLTHTCLAGWLFSWLLNSVEQEVFMRCIHSVSDHTGNTLAQYKLHYIGYYIGSFQAELASIGSHLLLHAIICCVYPTKAI